MQVLKVTAQKPHACPELLIIPRISAPHIPWTAWLCPQKRARCAYDVRTHERLGHRPAIRLNSPGRGDVFVPTLR